MYQGQVAFHAPADEAAARAEQERLRSAVEPHGALPRPLRYVAGLDVAYAVDETHVAGAVAVLDIRNLELIDSATSHRPVEFPYVPGLLAFREIPALLDALERLSVTPDVMVCDGYGLAHPRRFGLACHLGVLTGVPTFGVAKTPFVGSFKEPGRERGAVSDLVDVGEGEVGAWAGASAGAGTGVRGSGEHRVLSSTAGPSTVGMVECSRRDCTKPSAESIIGRVLRTQSGIKPVFISVGHRIGLDEATGLTLRLAPSSPGFRLPETTRRSDRLSRQALAESEGGGGAGTGG